MVSGNAHLNEKTIKKRMEVRRVITFGGSMKSCDCPRLREGLLGKVLSLIWVVITRMPFL